jgi:hypothetical protein
MVPESDALERIFSAAVVTTVSPIVNLVLFEVVIPDPEDPLSAALHEAFVPPSLPRQAHVVVTPLSYTFDKDPVLHVFTVVPQLALPGFPGSSTTHHWVAPPFDPKQSHSVLVPLS